VTEQQDADQPTNEVVQPRAESKQSNQSKQQAPKATKAERLPKKPISLLAVLALFLVLLAFVAIAGLGWKGVEFIQQLSAIELQLQQSEQSKAAVTKKLSRLQKEINTQTTLQQHTSQRLAQLPGADTDDWLIAEAEYLLRLANQRLNLEKDWQGALAILIAADSILLETKNPQLDSIRLILANEIVTLRAVPAVDITGAVSRIQAVQEQITLLEWVPRKLPKDVAKIETSNDKVELSSWEKFLDKAWKGLNSIVRIRDNGKALPAPLTPDQYYYLQQNMQLMLEQAQVALVRQQAELYLHSINRTEAWLSEFVRGETAQAQALQQTLNELAQWEVAPTFPDISGSLLELRRYSGGQK
jgi:uroporphyrin-3 C-methyltransferase